MRLFPIHKALSAILVVVGSLLSSCDGPFYEYEGDCEVHHYVRFVYDMNLKWANAFPSEVKSVNLYIFDEKGLFVKAYKRDGEELADPDFAIQTDLPAGSYRLLAWCGLENPGVARQSFSLTEPKENVTSIDDMICKLITSSESVYGNATEGAQYSSERPNFLYWGYLEADFEDNGDGASYDYTIKLTKDTNHIRIMLQELDGDIIDPAEFRFSIEADNGIMNWDNMIVGDDIVVYQPWSQTSDEIGVGTIDPSDASVSYYKGVVADISMARLLASESSSVFLTISNRDSGAVIARVPVIQYALLSKEYYEEAYSHKMTDQEFLDREDEYNMTFFLRNGKWMNSYIYIQQWRIVLHDYDF